MIALLASTEARRGFHLGQACTELESLVAAARWRRRWSHQQHDRAATLTRKIYALGLLQETAPMAPATADEFLRRLRALAADRQALLDDPADFAAQLSDLAEEIRETDGDDTDAPEDLKP